MTKRRAYSYTRVSTSMQIDGYSLDAQAKKIKNYAESRDIEIIRQFSDEGKSGKSIEGREEFKRMLEYVKSKEKIDCIIVYKLSRFGRNTRDILESYELLKDYDVDLICIEDGIDTSSGMGKALITILGAISEIERENIAVQTMAGRKEKARQGKWNGGQAPYGYRLKNGLLEVNKEEAEIVKMIYDLYLNKNKGLNAIANYLNDRGYRKSTYKNNKLTTFSYHFIRGILDNPVYMGKIAYGRRKIEKKKGTKNEYHHVKKDDYILSEGIHNAIVDEFIWNSVSKKRKATGVFQPKAHSLNHEHKLTGVLKCPECGSNMYGNVNRRKKKKDNSYDYIDEFYYVCKHRKLVDGRKCDFRKQPKQDRVDEEVYSALMSADIINFLIEDLKEKTNATTDKEKIEKELKGLENSRKNLKIQIQNIHDRIDNLDVNNPAYHTMYNDLVYQQEKKYIDLSRVSEEITKVDKKLQGEIITINSVFDEIEVLTNILPLWSKMSELEQKEFYLKYIERVEIFDDYDKYSRIVKKIVFKFPLRFLIADDLNKEMVPVPNSKLIEKNGEMIPSLWELDREYIETNEIEWDKYSKDECVVLLERK